MRVLPAARTRLQKERLPDLQIVHAGAHGLRKKGTDLVAIPVLPVVAATHGGKGDPEDVLDQTPPETVLAAPSSWCPNPAYTSCLRVRGRSMMPVLHNGYIIAVDKSQSNRHQLYGEIVMASHQEQGLIVSRLQRFDGTEVLVPENREHDSIAIIQRLADCDQDPVVDRTCRPGCVNTCDIRGDQTDQVWRILSV